MRLIAAEQTTRYTGSFDYAWKCRGGSVNRPLLPGARAQCDSSNSILCTTTAQGSPQGMPFYFYARM